MNNRIYQSPDLYTVLSNRLLTSLHSLQSSLDVLRSHRPDFAPRTGFIWPIVEAPTTDTLAKKQPTEEDAGDVDPGSESLQKKSVATTSTAKKQQNILPLVNAMRTTAAHSTASFVQRSSESVPPDVQRDISRSSATPAPNREETPTKVGARTPAPQEPVRPPLPGGKKKRKRMSSTTAGAG